MSFIQYSFQWKIRRNGFEILLQEGTESISAPAGIYVIKEHHGYPITSFIIIPAFILIFLFITIILPLIIAFINFQELIVEIKNKNITPLEIINAIIFNCLLLVISYYAINYSINFEIQDLPYPLFDDENEILVYLI